MHETQEVADSQKIFFFGKGAVEGDPTAKHVLGGKGASLAAMTQAGLPVPPGFTISIQCCKYYHDNGQQWPDGLKDEVKTYISRLEKQTGQTFAQGTDPLLVSVRSGAAQSMPGMMDTILNCGLHPGLADSISNKDHFWGVYAGFIRQYSLTTEDDMKEDPFNEAEEKASSKKDLADAFIGVYEKETGRTFPTDPWDALFGCINAVFDSWNNERAKIYRKSHGHTALEGTAVNVQSMFDSEISGIAFTADPSHPDRNVIIIESSYGLGESIVSGNVTPDRYVLNSETLEMVEQEIGHKGEVMSGLTGEKAEGFDPDASSLTDAQIKECGEIALKIEEYFGFPVDIEWGLKNGTFSLLQSRKVRGLDIARDVEVGRKEEVERLKEQLSDRTKVWVVHNLSETLPAPTPLTWDVIRQFMSGNGGYGVMYQDFGYLPSDEVKNEGFLDLILGRIYTDPDRAAHVFWKGMPFTYKVDEILDDPDVILGAPSNFDPEKADGQFLLRLPATLVGMLKSSRKMKKARKAAKEAFDKEVSDYTEYLEKKRKQDLPSLSDAEVLSELKERIQKVMTDFGKESLKPGFFGGLAMAELEGKLTQLMGTGEGTKLSQTLTSGLDGDSTMEQELFLHRAAAGKETIEEFITRYGHRTVGEMELSVPRWREDPSYIEDTARTISSTEGISPEKLHHSKKEARLKALEELPATAVKWGGSFMKDDLLDLAREAALLLPFREVGKHYLMMGYEIIRQAILELGRRWKLGDNVFFLHLDELDEFGQKSEELTETAEKRKVRWQALKRLDHPDVINSEEIDSLGLPREIKASRLLEGKSLSGGVAEGTARIVFHPGEAGDLTDAILVCPSTDPSWTSLFTRIKGVIVERGGVLSHGAITARDFGIPCAACKDATKIIPEGARIRINGDTGVATVIDEEK